MDNVEIVKLLFKQGLERDISRLDPGEPGFTTDTNKMFVGSSKGNIELAKAQEVNAKVNETIDMFESLDLRLTEIEQNGIKGSGIEQGDTPPEEGEPGTLWLDTSDSGNQATIFEGLDNRVNWLGSDLLKVIQDLEGVNQTLESHNNHAMPHKYTDEGKTYRWGFRTKNGKPQIIYEEVK